MGKYADRFKDKVMADDGCWSFNGYKSGGYAYYYDGTRDVRAHRYAYELWKGDIPEGSVVMHSCDNKGCVNPAHLTAGTQQQNILDVYKRGLR